MKKILYALLLSSLFFSCGETPETKVEDPVFDSFRESVLKLKRNGFLKKFQDQNIDSLIAFYRKDSLNGIKNMMADAGDLLSMNIALNGRAPHEVYKAISDTIGMRFPDLKTEEIKHAYLPEEPGDKDTGWVLIEQKFGNAWYSRKLYYFNDWPVDNFIYRMYNTRLADSSANERLYLIEYFCENCRDTTDEDDFMGNLDIDRMGLLRLTKAQADTLMSIPQLGMDPEDEFAVYPTQKVNEEMKRFEASGLVGPKDAKWLSAVKQEISWNSVYSQEDLFDFLDTLFGTIMFDTLNDYNPYEEILIGLSDISRGKFIPDRITDEGLGMGPVRSVSYVLGGRKYQMELETKNGLQSPDIVELVNQSLDENKAGGAFYTVLTREDLAIMAFIPDAALDKVKSCGFFPVVEKGVSEELKQRYHSGMHP